LEVTISRVTFNKFNLACKYLGKFEEMKRFWQKSFTLLKRCLPLHLW